MIYGIGEKGSKGQHVDRVWAVVKAGFLQKQKKGLRENEVMFGRAGLNSVVFSKQDR